MFRLDADCVFAVEDLIFFDKGPLVEQQEKQRRVLACVLEMGTAVSNIDGYFGPRLDEVNLGTLGPNDFFGELSLLPLNYGWRHRCIMFPQCLMCVALSFIFDPSFYGANACRRTVVAASNVIMYSLSKHAVSLLGNSFQSLKHLLQEHAADYTSVVSAQRLKAGAEVRMHACV